MSLKSSFGALEDAGGSWQWFGILILIWIWSLVFDTPMIQILALYLDFEGAKNIHVLNVLIWGFGGPWMFLTGVWQHDLDFYTMRNLASFSEKFWWHPDQWKLRNSQLSKSLISSDKLFPGWVVGWVVGWVSLENKDQLSSGWADQYKGWLIYDLYNTQFSDNHRALDRTQCVCVGYWDRYVI